MRDDLQLIRDKTTELEIKVDRDINELKSSVEKGKNDTVRDLCKHGCLAFYVSLCTTITAALIIATLLYLLFSQVAVYGLFGMERSFGKL